MTNTVSATGGDPPRQLGRHAIVIGGSVAGLVGARVLSDHFAEVTVIERDARPAGPEPRKGAPQMRHAHALFEPASKGLEAMFPAFLEELRAAGALFTDCGNGYPLYQYGAWKPRFKAGFDGITCSRPLIEWLVRQRTEALPNVKIRYEHAVEDLLTSPDRGRVTGVRAKGAAGEEALSADLVLDTAGRGTRVPRWLDALGYGRPEEQAVGVDLAYVSQLFERRSDARRDWNAVVVMSRAPGRRGGFLFAVEGERWIASLPGLFGDHCPTDTAGFLEFARSLPVPVIYDTLKSAPPLSEPAIHKVPSSRWFHYEKMGRLPEGLVMLGDSICAFNPVYGQGITVSVQCARELEAELSARRDLDGLPSLFQKRLVKVIGPAWMLSTTMDLRYPEATGERPPGTSTVQWLFANFLDMASVDERACRLLYDLMHMRRGPEAFLKPDMLFPLLAYCTKSLFLPLEKRINPGSMPPAA